MNIRHDRHSKLRPSAGAAPRSGRPAGRRHMRSSVRLRLLSRLDGLRRTVRSRLSHLFCSQIEPDLTHYSPKGSEYIEAELLLRRTLGGPRGPASDQGGFFVACDNPDCTPPSPLAQCIADAPSGVTNVGYQGELSYFYGLSVGLDRPAFTAGGVQLESTTAGTVGAIAITVESGPTLNIGAGFPRA